jgi:hypothetical protein
MENTTPTPVGFLGALKLVVLLLLRPARFLELQAEDNAVLNAVKNPTRVEGAHVVRRAFFASLILVIASAAAGYALGALGGRVSCVRPGTVAWLQIVGTSLLLWGTLFIRGWEIQTHGGITLTERVNQWIYRGLYCLGTAVLVSSLAVPTCG